jgi:hypothetical protein
MDVPDSPTQTLIHDIHHAWKNKATLAQYALLRDQVTAQQDRLDVQIAALSTVVRLVLARSVDGPAAAVDDEAWQDFFHLAVPLHADEDNDADEQVVHSPSASRKRPRNYNEASRHRSLAIIEALWSPEVVQYYGWRQVGQGQVRLVRTCALQYPDFAAELVPRLNSVLFHRHCVALLHGHGSTLNEARLQPYKDFDLEALETAAVGAEQQAREEEWLVSRDGMVRLGPSAAILRHLRPEHFGLYLLQKDRHQVLEPRCAGSGSERGMCTPASAANDQGDQGNQGNQGDRGDTCIDGRSSNDLLSTDLLDAAIRALAPNAHDTGDDRDAEAQLRDAVQCGDIAGWRSATGQISLNALQSDAPFSTTCLQPTDPDTLVRGQSGRWRPDASTPYRLHDADATMMSTPSALDPEMGPGTGAAMGEPGQPWSPTWFGTMDEALPPSTAFQDFDIGLDPWFSADLFPTRDMSAPVLSTTASPLESQAQEKRGRPRRCSAFQSPGAHVGLEKRGCHVQVHSQNARSSIAGCEHDLPAVNVAERCGPASTPLLIASDPIQVDTPELRIEERLHNKHRAQLVAYAETLTELNTLDGRPSTRAQWLTSKTQWASVWSANEALGRGSASCEAQADVLYYTAADFVAAAASGTAFRKPLVIKEQFADRGMHTFAQYLSLLQDSCSRSCVDVRRTDSKTAAPMGVERFVQLARGPPASPADGSNALNLGNLSKAHRPLFTMLPRFRLLETLTASLQPSVGKRTHSTAVDVDSCFAFNILGLPGAFSGAHVDALCGTWVRALDGVKYWMIVPERNMASQWDALMEQGDDWLPRGQERLIVLEEDDVLLMPPGLRVVHAVHTPVSCLMEGGMLWDDLNVPEILRSVLWVCKNQLATNESIARQLPRTIADLRRLVHARVDRFRGMQDRAAYLETVESAMQDFESLGCRCVLDSCGTSCECLRSGRRCTSWCCDHPEFAHSACMD